MKPGEKNQSRARQARLGLKYSDEAYSRHPQAVVPAKAGVSHLLRLRVRLTRSLRSRPLQSKSDISDLGQLIVPNPGKPEFGRGEVTEPAVLSVKLASSRNHSYVAGAGVWLCDSNDSSF